MIKILIKYVENSFDYLEIKGHANSDVRGKDLVCSAVSAVSIGCLNNLENAKALDIEIEEGLLIVKKIANISTHDEIVLQTLVCGLKTIEESYSQFIRIKNL